MENNDNTLQYSDIVAYSEQYLITKDKQKHYYHNIRVIEGVPHSPGKLYVKYIGKHNIITVSS